MKSRFTLLVVAVAAIFTSCSKEAHFAYSNQNYGGYHKTEEKASKPETAVETVAQPTLTASAETQPSLASQTTALSAAKAAQTEVTEAATTEAAVATAAATMTKKEVKAVAKEIKKEVKKSNKGLMAGGKSQVIALILAILVGWVSAHRFYLGYTKIAILQLLSVLLCGLGLIWVIIDIVRIITGDLQPNDGSYEKTL